MINDSNTSNIGISGRVVDETRNTLIIDEGLEERRIAKRCAVFLFKLPDGTQIEVEGSYLIGRPEDRVKRRTRRW